MSESNPLAGLTTHQADAAIERLQAKVNEGVGGKAAAAHLKAMKAARKDLTDPEPAGNGTKAYAEPAEISVEGGEV